MSQSGYTDLSGLEQLVMSVLWTKKEATVRDVLTALPEPEPGYRAVSKALAELTQRDMVAKIVTSQPRKTVYVPRLSSHEAREEILHDILHRLFSGSPAILIRHLLETEGFTLPELTSIRQVLDRQENTIASSPRSPKASSRKNG
jgi:predicted transcriptional regulator